MLDVLVLWGKCWGETKEIWGTTRRNVEAGEGALGAERGKIRRRRRKQENSTNAPSA